MDKKTAIKIYLKTFLGTNDKDIADNFYEISKVVTVKAKENLFREDDNAEYMYFVISGTIKLYRVSNDGKEIVIRIVSPQEIFAEATLARLQKYPVSSTAIKKSELLAIDVEQMRKIACENPEFMMQLLEAMTVQLKYMLDTISSLISDNTAGRLIKYLKKLSQNANNESFTLPISKSELSLLLGTTPETVSRIFKKLKNDGVIKQTGKKIELLK